jgi:hypothetical protein
MRKPFWEGKMPVDRPPTFFQHITDILRTRGPADASVRITFVGLIIIYLAYTYKSKFDDLFGFLILCGVSIYVFGVAARLMFIDIKPPDVIPEKDREFLVEIIKQNGRDGIDTYVKLSSLYGFTGNITKLGLSGLPLLTVALTIFFTSLAALLWSLGKPEGANSIVGAILDLAKLTLGAFIGSFVQRNVSAVAAATNATDQARRDLAHLVALAPNPPDRPKPQGQP